MPGFRDIVEAPENSKHVLQGNIAFALGVVHAGFHAADGYPGTPSTEVIDRALAHVQDKIKVGWSVNEAVAVGVCVGHALAGYDSIVTMKIPGVFQAGDVISTSAFYTSSAGSLVIYAATDYIPSSTQHVIDPRYFFASSRIPVLEPRTHQEMYEIAWTAADISRMFKTPVVVLASGILAHSEGLVSLKAPRIIEPRKIPENLHNWMLMPSIARKNYNKATSERIPSIQNWAETSDLVEEIKGSENWGIIVNGESNIIVREALHVAETNPSILTLGITYPLPEKRIKSFAEKIKEKILVIEDGDKFLQEKIKLLGLDITGKDKHSTKTTWTPEDVLLFLSEHVDLKHKMRKKEIEMKPVTRPPSICPGCPYRAFALVVSKLKKQKKIFASFGDIGCSTLLYFIDAIDTVMCMSGSESMRQGFVLSKPEMAGRTISVTGDSCECHSGLDSTRNSVFRNIPGVKVILDNSITAMTGGQPSPGSEVNLANQPHKFDLKKAMEAEVERTVVVDAYNMKEIERELKKSLSLAENGVFTAIIIRGACIQEVTNREKVRKIQFDYDKCKMCGLCNICSGIEIDENKKPHFTALCTNCGSNQQVCLQCCNLGAIIPLLKKTKKTKQKIHEPEIFHKKINIKKDKLPKALRVAIRGIGGQGNLFFGRVLSQIAKLTPYSDTHIVKGDTHGMAQLGGPVISTFACGEVFSPIFAPNSTEALIVMEVGEVLRPGFLDLLKPGGTIIFNDFSALPLNVKREEYPELKDIETILKGFRVLKIDANRIAIESGDPSGRTANVVVLGLLSSTEPFSDIPEEIWISALTSVSADDYTKSVNILSFRNGRNFLKKR